MGAVAGLRCPRCDRESLSKTAFYCLECDSILEVHVDISHLVGAQFDTLRASRDHSIWRWFDFFPLQHRSSIVSLGEGDTPLIRARRLGAYLDLSNLYLKNDTVLPTGSLKDRSNSVGISVGKELGFDTATVMSTGNAAASLTVAIGAPQSAIDPEFGKLESIRIRLCLSGESHSSTAENRNALFFIALGERDRYASNPLAGLSGFRFKLNSVAAIRFCSHLECRSKRVMALSLHA